MCAELCEDCTVGMCCNCVEPHHMMLQLYLKDEGGRNWVKGSMDSKNLKYDSGSVLNVFPEMCSQGRHKKLSDFDDHLNDLSRWVSLPSPFHKSNTFARHL